MLAPSSSTFILNVEAVKTHSFRTVSKLYVGF
nr:MAG TPA: hypothetical protein [Caudoviricetes sp.]